jgi:hypothetical protein
MLRPRAARDAGRPHCGTAVRMTVLEGMLEGITRVLALGES